MKVLEVGKARPILKSHLLRPRSSAIRQDSDVAKAKVPQLHMAASAASALSHTHAQQGSAQLSPSGPEASSRAAPPCPPLLIWESTRSPKAFSTKVNVGTRGKGKTQRWPGWEPSGLRNSALHIFTKLLGHTRHWRHLLFGPGLVVYIRWQPKGLRKFKARQGWTVRRSQARVDKHTGVFCCFHFSYLLMK